MIYFLIYQPLYNLLTILSFIFNGNLGWAIFTLAFILRLIILPLNRKTLIQQNKLAKLQPKIKEIQQKYKQNPEQANKEVIELFKQEKVNPFSSLGEIVIQVFIFIVLFGFFTQAIKSTDWTPHLYYFLKITPQLNYIFLGFIDLRVPNLLLAILSAVINAILILVQPNPNHQNKTMFLVIPFIIVFYWKMFPAAVIIYWIAISLVGIAEAILTKKLIETQNNI